MSFEYIELAFDLAMDEFELLESVDEAQSSGSSGSYGSYGVHRLSSDDCPF